MLTIINTRWEAAQRVVVEKLTRLTHKIAIKLHLWQRAVSFALSLQMANLENFEYIIVFCKVKTVF
jgi:hypothetical protein